VLAAVILPMKIATNPPTPRNMSRLSIIFRDWGERSSGSISGGSSDTAEDVFVP